MKNKSINEAEQNAGMQAGTINGPVTLNIHQGLTEEQVRNLIETVLEEKISKYRLEALEVAKLREESLTSRLVGLLLRDPAKWERDEFRRVLSDPSMQADFNTAYEGYIKYGGDDLLNNLADLLDKRMNQPSRSLLQITLSEAIRVCPLLGKKHFAFLALVFITTKAKLLNIPNKTVLYAVFGSILGSLYEACKTLSRGDIEHLIYAGCGIRSAFSGGGICDRVRADYPEALLVPQKIDSFSKDASGLTTYEKVPGCFRRYGDQIGIVPCTKEVVKAEAERVKASAETITALLAEYDREVMSVDALRADLCKVFPFWKEFEDFYDKNGFSSFELTSVGIVLGGVCAKRLTSIDSDLSIWIDDTVLV
ncbi:MAG: hypothetical protein IJS37_03745 [Bacilli bacterium]|nr:hypothetical protein [Bacilli bacterium]